MGKPRKDQRERVNKALAVLKHGVVFAFDEDGFGELGVTIPAGAAQTRDESKLDTLLLLRVCLGALESAIKEFPAAYPLPGINVQSHHIDIVFDDDPQP